MCLDRRGADARKPLVGVHLAAMVPVIERDCRDDIGGDEQRVDRMHTQYNDVTSFRPPGKPRTMRWIPTLPLTAWTTD